MVKQNEIVYLSFNQAQELVDRIARRAEKFYHVMQENEKYAMAHLLSQIGVKTEDIIDVSNLADNYAINAEIVSPEETKKYGPSKLQDALFTWEDDETSKTWYCLSW